MNRKSPVATLVLAVLILVLLLGGYVGGYFWLGPPSAFTSARDDPSPPEMVRGYPTAWLCRIYEPAGKLESWVRGKKVGLWPKNP